MKTITNFTDKQLTKKIKNLLNSNFKKNNALHSFVSEYITLECNWEGCEYNTFVYLEKISNPKYKYAICVGLDEFPYSEEGIKQAVDYINK